MSTSSTSTQPSIGSSQNAEEDMTANKALDVLIQCAYAGQSRGAWRMEEVPVILKAINFFVKQSPTPSSTN
jgi:hypothetical protein